MGTSLDGNKKRLFLPVVLLLAILLFGNFFGLAIFSQLERVHKTKMDAFLQSESITMSMDSILDERHVQSHGRVSRDNDKDEKKQVVDWCSWIIKGNHTANLAGFAGRFTFRLNPIEYACVIQHETSHAYGARHDDTPSTSCGQTHPT